MEEDFKTPPGHVGFRARRLFDAAGTIVDGAIAYLEPGGGGPVQPHTHDTDHLFIVVSGEAKVLLDGKEAVIPENGSLLVRGCVPHSVWNNADRETVMVGITVRP